MNQVKKIPSILYMGEKKDISSSSQKLLNDFCNNLYIKEDNKSALEIYNEHSPSVIISTSKSIEALKKIKELNDETIIITAIDPDDTNSFKEFLKLETDGNLPFPIQSRLLEKKLTKVSKQIRLKKEVKKQDGLISNILNAQSNFTILTDGKYLVMANQTMLEFFGFKSLDEFHKEYDCICDFFMEEEGYLTKVQNGKVWINVILENLDIVHKVKMLDENGNECIFLISTKGIVFDDKNHYIIIFTDVSNLERLNKEKLLQEKISAKQQKMASMGEMIGNIAHQWRQPLSSISSIASSIQLQSQANMDINRYSLVNDMQKILNKVDYLTENITTFRNFLKDNKEYKNINLQNEIDKAIKISNVILKDNGIRLIKNINYDEKINLKLVSGELPEVILNIINNSKDAIIDNKTDNSWVKIDLNKENDKAIITIEDNAGGIPKKILPNIFDEYFTTKDEESGTGLGLHMSKRIIKESLKGDLYADNSQNGALFTIKLPLE